MAVDVNGRVMNFSRKCERCKRVFHISGFPFAHTFSTSIVVSIQSHFEFRCILRRFTTVSCYSSKINIHQRSPFDAALNPKRRTKFCDWKCKNYRKLYNSICIFAEKKSHKLYEENWITINWFLNIAKYSKHQSKIKHY